MYTGDLKQVVLTVNWSLNHVVLIAELYLAFCFFHNIAYRSKYNPVHIV